MNLKNKKYYPYYIGIIILCLSVFIVLIDKKIIRVDQYGIESDDILVLVGIISAIIAFLAYLSNYDKRIKKLKILLNHRLHLSREEDSRSFEKIHLLPAKNLLIGKVKKSCEQILENELVTTIKNSEYRNKAGYIVKTNHHFYENFGDLKKKERSTATIENLDLRRKISGLVITGEPGNGKTFGLARWINDLIKSITEDINVKGAVESKIPVFISLNNWNNTELTDELFEEWLVEAIIKQYDGLDIKIIRHLVQQHEIIPCADGLDEVADEYRFGCLKSIVKYAGIKNSLAFSCRKLIFQDLLARENFEAYTNIAVFELQTLSEEKIFNTIQATKQNANELIRFLNNNKALINYINTPLFLNLYMLTFDVLTIENKRKIRETNSQLTFEYIMWEKYDDLMMHEKVLKNRPDGLYTLWTKRIRTYMVALSRNVQGNMFFIEHIQPAWLGSPGRILLYYFTSRIISGLIVSMAIGCFIASLFSFIGIGIIASLVITVLTLWMNASKENNTLLHKVPPPLLFSLILVIITALYQGFSVIRRPEDMKLNHSFSVTESLPGILVGLFFGVIFGMRKVRQDKKTDILPVQLFFFNWRHSLALGTTGGVGIGMFIGVAAICVKYFFPETTFSRWLNRTVDALMSSFPGMSASVVADFAVTFTLGCIIGFIFGFIVSALLAGLDREKMEVELNKKLKLEEDDYFRNKNETQFLNISLNNGIKQSLVNSLKYGLIAFVILTFVHGILIFLYIWLAGNRVQPENFTRALMVGAGSGIVSFLWFGGFEVIQHYCLRIYLYFFGITPLQLDRWVKKLIDLAFMRKVGAGLQFYHPKIKDYFNMISFQEKADERLTDTSRKKASRIFHVAFGLVAVTLLILPLYNRSHKYWKSADDIFSYTSRDNNISRSTTVPGRFTVNRNGRLHITVKGRINIGTFTGYIGPEGTEVGLFGFPIMDIYDEVPRFRHGALLYKVNSTKGSTWKPVWDTVIYFKPWKTMYKSFDVRKGDTLYFMLNDKECENNFGKFTLSLAISN